MKREKRPGHQRQKKGQGAVSGTQVTVQGLLCKKGDARPARLSIPARNTWTLKRLN